MSSVITHAGHFVDFYLDDYMGLGLRSSRSSEKIRSSEKGEVWVSFNGEIYNRKALIQSLESIGHDCQDCSDAEIVANLYLHYGEEAFGRLNGKFAVAIFDNIRKEMILAIDKLGEKSLYYTFADNLLLFSSEIKSLLQYEEISAKLNTRVLDYYLCFGFVPPPDTMFEEIYKLPPAHILTYSQKGKFSFRQYWDLEKFNASRFLKEQDSVKEVFEKITESIGIRSENSDELGILLSGGLDSATIAAILRKVLIKPIRAFSVIYENEYYNEIDNITKIVDFLNLDHQIRSISPKEINEKLIRRLVWLYDEPTSDPAIVPAYLTSFFVSKKNIQFMFTGLGGDEVFLGHQPLYWKEPEILECYSDFPPLLKNTIAKLCVPTFEKFAKRINSREIELALDFFNRNSMSDPDPEIRFAARALVRCFSPEQLRFLRLNYKAQKSPYELVKETLRKYSDASFINKEAYATLKLNLVHYVQSVERASDMFSIGVLNPFLDNDLVDFAFSLPVSLKLRGGYTKYILRKTLSNYGLLPKEIIFSKKKRGFDAPIEHWLKSELKEFVQENLLEDRSHIIKYFNEGYLRRIVLKGDRYSALKVWNLLLLKVWYDIYIEEKIRHFP